MKKGAYLRRVDICSYALPEAVTVAAEMEIPRDRDALVFTISAQKLEFERRVRERRNEAKRTQKALAA